MLEEAKFEDGIEKLDLDQALGSIAGSIRRNMLKLLQAAKQILLMEITREPGIEDHTKVVFTCGY